MTKRPRQPDPDDKVEAIVGHYEPRITPGRENYDVLDWASGQSQQERFRVLADSVDLAGNSLLDVGCGLGDLWGYLKRRDIPVHYTGVDLVEKMIEAARAQHPDGQFLCADIFGTDVFGPESFDVIFCSGIFNLNLGNNHEFLAASLPRLLDLARGTVVFNLLHRRALYGEQQEYFHFHPKEVLRLLAPLPCTALVLEDYLPNDFTVICRKQAAR